MKAKQEEVKEKQEPVEQKVSKQSIKPAKLDFKNEKKEEAIPKNSQKDKSKKQDNKKKQENKKKPKSEGAKQKPQRKEESKAKLKQDERNAAKFFKDFTVKLDTEELNLTGEQQKIIDLFQISYKKPKGSRALILDRELALLKNIPVKYKEAIIENDVNREDLDTCPHLGEKIVENEDGTITWTQVDIQAMKMEKKKQAAIQKEKKMSAPGAITLPFNGEDIYIGDRNYTKRKEVESYDDGKIKILYHGTSGPLKVFVLEILKDGEFIQEITDEKVVSI